LPDPFPVSLPLDAAETLHAHLERVLDTHPDPELSRAHRTLAWRILAARDTDAAGLTSTLSKLAREARTLEEYEAARDDLLGPLLDRLESPENRDP
jgi:sirohydrochlorin ferrochelatase